MADVAHSQVIEGSRHPIHNLTYPNSASRIAGINEGSGIVLASTNLWQIAKQDDNDSLWMLTQITPILWMPLAGVGAVDLDVAYDNFGGAGTVDIDNGDLTFDLSGGTSDFEIVNGTDAFRIAHHGANLINLEASLENFTMALSGNFTLSADGSFSTSVDILSLSSDTYATLEAITYLNFEAGTEFNLTADTKIDMQINSGYFNLEPSTYALISAGSYLDFGAASYFNLTAGNGITFEAFSGSITLNEVGEITLDGNFTATSIIGALNEVKSGGIVDFILDSAYDNDSGERTITVDSGDVSWDVVGNYWHKTDIASAGADYGWKIEYGTDYLKFFGTGDGNTAYLDCVAEAFVLPSPSSAPADSVFSNSQWSLFLDETENLFELKAKKSGGSVISATINKFDEQVNIPIEWAEDGSSPPAYTQLITSGNGNIRVRKFDDASVEDIVIPWKVPHDIYVDDGIKFSVDFVITESTGPSGEGVSFKLSGYSVGNNDSISGSFGTEIEANSGSITASQYDFFATDFSDKVTITNLKENEQVFFHFERDTADADDDYAQDVGVSGINIIYTRIAS